MFFYTPLYSIFFTWLFLLNPPLFWSFLFSVPLFLTPVFLSYYLLIPVFLYYSLSLLFLSLFLFSLSPPWSGDTLTSPGQATQREESFEGQVKILSEQLKEVTAYWDRPCLRILFFPYCNILFLSFFFGPGSNFFFIIHTWFRVYLSCCIS